MPGNRIRIPKGSAVRFVRVSPPRDPRYNFIYWDDDWFENTIMPYQSRAEYFRKWQKNDTISLQFKANYDLIVLELWDCVGNVVDTFDPIPAPSQVTGTGFDDYQIQIPLSDYPEGIYYFVLTGGMGDQLQRMVSDGIDLKVKHEGTMLLEYSNSYNKGGITWDTGIVMCYRVEGEMVDYEPGSDDVVYIDQPHNTELLSSVPYDGYTFAIGGSYGVPNYVARDMVEIFSFDNVRADGKEIVKAQGAKMERVDMQDYPMYGWKLAVSLAQNVDFTEFDDTFDDEIEVAFNIQTDLFGIFPPEDGSAAVTENL